MEPLLSEKELKQLFIKEKKFLAKFKKIWRPIKVFFWLFAAAFLLYIIVNGQSFLTKFRYFWESDYRDKEYTGGNWQTGQQLIGPATEPSAKPVIPPLTIDNPQDNYLYLPAINVKTPIVWDAAEKDVIESLRRGVVHLADTGHPDEEKTNIFITGHSSYYLWDKGQYKTIFSLLDKLKPDDRIVLIYKNVRYDWQVETTIVVYPNKVEYLKPLKSQSGNILSLMTCVPVGTNLKRLIVRAKEIGRTPSDQKSTTSPAPKKQPNFQKLPSTFRAPFSF
ncbi:MAG: Sortase family protein [Candidatus Berkelbacteria bacterium Licking1014_2]|uniref:Sortase family protein n=1 Tax=Candidatus Berkelbacteria bacterium Licking1014_2 TaxID=2017146 RepID=A0A554LX57_9BACT|nr:MAG: Sortase family protein [Candidatus Berkelbacteria bacterium Licking1014_2]